MSTRSLVGRLNEDGTVTYVNNTFDGYLAHTGVILMLYWSDPSLVDALLAQGSISSLGTEMGVKHEDGIRRGWGAPPEKDAENFTVFYARDRGQEIKINTAVSADAFRGTEYDGLTTYQSGAQYRYLYRNGVWLVSQKGGSFIPIMDAIRATDIKQAITSEDFGLVDVHFSDDGPGAKAVPMQIIMDVLAKLPDGSWEFRTDKPTFPELRIDDASTRAWVIELVNTPAEIAA